MPPRFAPTIAVALGLALGAAGCDSTPRFDPALQYSADTLAQEFLYGYGELKTSDGSAVRSKGPTPRVRPEAVAKEAATKKAEVVTLDDLIAETIRKAAGIPGTTPALACKKVAEEVAKSPSIPDGDKKVIAEALGRVGP